MIFNVSVTKSLYYYVKALWSCWCWWLLRTCLITTSCKFFLFLFFVRCNKTIITLKTCCFSILQTAQDETKQKRKQKQKWKRNETKTTKHPLQITSTQWSNPNKEAQNNSRKQSTESKGVLMSTTHVHVRVCVVTLVERAIERTREQTGASLHLVKYSTDRGSYAPVRYQGATDEHTKCNHWYILLLYWYDWQAV